MKVRATNAYEELKLKVFVEKIEEEKKESKELDGKEEVEAVLKDKKKK